ncbi:Transcriptional regulator CRZ1 [Paramyrothecium foliicola]|nr:Transcriptional regulator CRZ1 [Paramyrothecium foliicola]
MHYQDLFGSKPHLLRVLVLIYQELLKLQSILLRCFQQPRWEMLFTETWSTYQSRISNIISNIARQRSLIESHASTVQTEVVEQDFHDTQQREDDEFEEEDLRRLQIVTNWIRATNVAVDQDEFLKARTEYPGTGQWLLDNTLFNEWFDPQYPTIPPLLWLNGIPGAGKTILASMVVEAAQKLAPAPTVLYFYFKHGNPERNNFMALARSLLIQLLKQDRSLLPMFYQKCCLSGEIVLTTPDLTDELLSQALDNSKTTYIILDGLDECPREERKSIAQRFKNLIEDLPPNDSDRLRCLFVSQDDGAARKDFAGIACIKIRTEDTDADIKEYSRIEARKLKRSLDMTDEEASEIASKVAGAAEGLFLLAKLIWINLLGHTSIGRLRDELQPNVFPREINDAYDRIMVRIFQQTAEAAKEDTLMLLGWLVCAKRELKWHEIQVMKSIDLTERTVSFQRQKFGKSLKDICASLVEHRLDGTVQFVHSTAKLFLIEKGHVIPTTTELKLACLCIDYLNLPAFTDVATESRVLNGDYGFMDYAVLNWYRHLDAGAASPIDGNEKLMNDITESLGIFIQHHWISPAANLTLAKRHSDRLQAFKDAEFFDKLEIIVASSIKQLKLFGKMKKDEIALDLVDKVAEARNALENTITMSTDETFQARIVQRYGTNLFKCPRFSCRFFTSGFPSAVDRDKHIAKHDRPFRCPMEGCTGFSWGFASEADREKHMKETHFKHVDQEEDLEFPTDQDVAQSIQSSYPTTQTQTLLIQDPFGNVPLPFPDEAEQLAPEPELESEPELQYTRRQKRSRQTEFVCEYCSKKFTKKYNLTSHLRTHVSGHSFRCDFCGKTFARSSDLGRHEKKHTGERAHVCGGYLRSGESWGCGKAFARADSLKQHHVKGKGKVCIRAWEKELLEQQAEQQAEQAQEQSNSAQNED